MIIEILFLPGVFLFGFASGVMFAYKKVKNTQQPEDDSQDTNIEETGWGITTDPNNWSSGPRQLTSADADAFLKGS